MKLLSGKGPIQPESPQFRFRVFTPEDLPELRVLYGHPDSVRYMSENGHAWNDEELLLTVARWQTEFAAFGYTKWRIETTDGQFVGRAGLSPMPDEPDRAELGYCIVRAEWGKGIATQLAAIVRDWVWQATTLPSLIGMTRLGNTASQHVLVKIGMMPVGQRIVQGDLCECFEIARPALSSPFTDKPKPAS